MSCFSLDVWFNFGSFVYGLEAESIRYNQGVLEVVLLCGSDSDRDEILDFLTELSENPKGLVKTEVRLFPGPYMASSLDFAKIPHPISLVTQTLPQPFKGFGQQGERPCLRLMELEGMSEGDRDGWATLVREVWSGS